MAGAGSATVQWIRSSLSHNKKNSMLDKAEGSTAATEDA